MHVFTPTLVGRGSTCDATFGSLTDGPMSASSLGGEEGEDADCAHEFLPALVSSPGKVIINGEHAVVYGKVSSAGVGGVWLGSFHPFHSFTSRRSQPA